MAFNTKKHRIGFLALPMVMWLTGPTAATDGGAPSLDELLEIVRPSHPPTTQPSQKDGPAQTPAPREVEAGVLQQLKDRPPADVLGQAVKRMDQVANRIADKRDVGLATQRLQESILANLDQVIAAAKKSALSGASGGSGSPDDTAQQQEVGSAMNTAQQGDAKGGGSQTGPAPGGSGSREPHAAAGKPQQPTMQDNQDRWGNLPMRLREDLLQGVNERFSSVYRELTGQYYRRLSQEGKP